MERQDQAIYIPKMDSLYRLFAPIQYNWIDKVTSKIYSLMELKNLHNKPFQLVVVLMMMN